MSIAGARKHLREAQLHTPPSDPAHGRIDQARTAVWKAGLELPAALASHIPTDDLEAAGREYAECVSPRLGAPAVTAEERDRAKASLNP